MSTSKDPVRLVLDADSPEAQRRLLRHDAGFEPPREAADQVWRSLAGALGAAAIGGAAGAPPKAKTTTPARVAATKLVAVALALGALTGVVVLGARLVAPPTAPTAPTAPESAASPPAARAPAWAPPPEPATGERSPWGGSPAPEASHSPPAAAAPRPAARLKPRPATPPGEESTLIDEARLALRGGDPARALKLLEESRRLFPAGAREEERELLTIQALVSAVRGREAKARAAAFLRKYPDGPRAREVRALGLGAPDAK